MRWLEAATARSSLRAKASRSWLRLSTSSPARFMRVSRTSTLTRRVPSTLAAAAGPEGPCAAACWDAGSGARGFSEIGLTGAASTTGAGSAGRGSGTGGAGFGRGAAAGAVAAGRSSSRRKTLSVWMQTISARA